MDAQVLVLLHHINILSNSPTSALYSSCPSLIHPTTAESSECFCRWHDLELYWKSEVYKLNRNGDNTVPYGAPAQHQIRQSTVQCHIPTCLSGSNPWDGGQVHLLADFFHFLPEKQQLDHVKWMWKFKDNDSHSAAVNIYGSAVSLECRWLHHPLPDYVDLLTAEGLPVVSGGLRLVSPAPSSSVLIKFWWFGLQEPDRKYFTTPVLSSTSDSDCKCDSGSQTTAQVNWT